MDVELDAKSALRALVEKAIPSCQVGPNLTQRDLNIAINDHELLQRAASALDAIPAVHKHYGTEATQDLARKFAYKFCSILKNGVFDEAEFESLWQSFADDLKQPTWDYVGVAHLQNIETDFRPRAIGEGVSIVFWDEKIQSIMGWSDPEEELFRREGWEIMQSLYVMVVKDKVTKNAENARQIAWEGLWKKANRALRALRLLKPGDVRIGRIWLAQTSSFSFLGSGVQSVGISMLRPGAPYYLATSDHPPVADTYKLVCDFESSQESLPKKKRELLSNIEVALRSFDAIYDRQFHRTDDQVVDAVTVLEALLRIGDSGLSYRTALRTAGLLANCDNERVRLFDDMGLYYDTRSKIVHGGLRKEKHEKVIQNNAPLLTIVRQLLLGFLKLTKPGAKQLDETLWTELDKTVLHSARREDLRRRMGLTELEDTIRARAYQLFEERGGTAGHAEDDWLKAEAEVLAARAEQNKPLSQRLLEMAQKTILVNPEPGSPDTKNKV